MRAASLGGLVLRHLVQPFLSLPLPVMLLENVVTYSMRSILKARKLNAYCPVCRVNPLAGAGDCRPPPGYARETIARMLTDEELGISNHG